MTNDDCRMNVEIQKTKKLLPLLLFRYSDLFRHSTFVLPHFPANSLHFVRSSFPEASTGIASTRRTILGIHKFGMPASLSLARSWVCSISTALSRTTASPLL